MTNRPPDWPFADPEDVVTITTRDVVEGRQPILLVAHDADDGTWMFLTGEPFSMDRAMMVTLYDVATRDPTIRELADLPLGWCASRESGTSPWVRQVDTTPIEDDER